MKSEGVRVECRECGKHFTTRSIVPTCPKCHGSDVELAGAEPGVRSV